MEASATLYPDKILIGTIDIVKEGFGISSANISILPIDTDNQTLGSTIRYHLNSTKMGLTLPNDYKKFYQNFLDKAGFKNGKEHHKNALYLTITQKQNQLTISPSRNGGFTGKNRGFLPIKDSTIFATTEMDNSTLASKVIEGWSKCECNCI